MAGGRLVAVAVALTGALSACELEEVVVVDVEDVVVAEVHVQIGQGLFGGDRVMAFLHRTVGGVGPGSHPVPGARVVISRSDGFSVELAETLLQQCVVSWPSGGTGTCLWAEPEDASLFAPGDTLELTISLPSGGTLRGATVVPGDFSLAGLEGSRSCSLPAKTPLTVRWSPAAGAWAYVNETSISGLQEALAPQGVEVDDPLHLLGLSVSAADTTIVFPGEFGIFNRFELDQDVAVTLQEGMPPSTEAVVTISAAERNYVNWVRGGNFNPSGLVRVPSLRGDGTGVFAATVTRTFQVLVGPDPSGAPYDAPACPVE